MTRSDGAGVISVLGVHAGRVPAGTESLLDQADLVAGGSEVLAALSPAHARQLKLGAPLEPALDELAAADGESCVLASGDPGFFGIVRALGARVGAERLGVHPAPSSVAVAFARIGMPWDDAIVLSAHGREPSEALHAAMRHPKVAILTAPSHGPEWFAARLGGTGRRLVVGQRLGHPDERIVSGSPGELAAAAFAQPNVLLVLDAVDGHAGATRYEDHGRIHRWPLRTPARWALPEEAFSHRAGMITKAEVRAVALAALGPGLGDLIWDVGCGSGSVAVECARLGAAVVAIDADPDAVHRTAANAAAHGVPVRVVSERAPGALTDLPDPDAVWVGGGGPDLAAILDVCATRAARTVVVGLAVFERVGLAMHALQQRGWEAEATMLQASRLRPLAGGHRLAATNPVFLITARRS